MMEKIFQPPHPSPSTGRSGGISIPNRDWIYGVLLCIAVFAAYQPAWNGKPVWDNDAHIVRPENRSMGGLAHIWDRPGSTQEYLPLLFSFFWAESHLWGDSPPGYHLFNILLHCAAAILLLIILRRLSIPGAWLATALFALHPVQVESVAWITEQKNTLSTIFFFCSVLAYLSFDRGRKIKFYLIALGLFVTGLMAKASIVPLPVALLIIFWWKRGRISWKRDAAPLLPFFGASIVYGLINIWVERKFIGAHGEAFSFSTIERLLIAGRAFWFYLDKIVRPSDLIFIYPRWKIDASAWSQYLFPGAVMVLGGVLWAIRKRNRAPFAVFLYFAAMLFPVAGFFTLWAFQYSFVADHWQHLAAIGPLVLAAAGVSSLQPFFRKTLHLPRWPVPVILAAILGILTFRQSRLYENSETLYRAVLRKNPDCFMAINNLGLENMWAGKLDEAEVRFRKAIELDPAGYSPYYNLGIVMMRTGRTAEAIAEFRKSLDNNPDYADARIELGSALMQENLTDEAINEFKKVLAVHPRALRALLNLGDAYSKLGRPEDAGDSYHTALQLKPSDLTILNNLCAFFSRIGRPQDAIEAATQAQALARASGQEDLAREIGRNIDEMRLAAPAQGLGR